MLCENCDTYDDGEGIVQFCPVHEAAPKMLAALKRLKKIAYPRPTVTVIIDKALKAAE